MDLLPKFLRQGYYIVNSQVSELPGQHWLAFNVKPHSIEVFDSFGFFYPAPLVNKLISTGKSVNFNNIRYQNFLSSNCGQLCLKWLSKQSKQS